jgi:hypothetical protein
VLGSLEAGACSASGDIWGGDARTVDGDPALGSLERRVRLAEGEEDVDR